MPYLPKHGQVEVSTSSLADIAFLLLSFFLMTTVINTEEGLPTQLPPWRDQDVSVPIAERNVLKIQVNSNDQLMVENEVQVDDAGLKELVKQFILNYGKDRNSSDNPSDAVVSLKADRGTSHNKFIEVLDNVQGAYYEIYAERTGIKTETFRRLSYDKPADRLIINRAKDGIPMNISVAEPTKVE